MKIKLRFYCNEHGYVPAGFGEPITEVNFNQHDELGRWCPICHKARPMTIEVYTTVLDKKGVEICEGDIVRWKIGSIKCVGAVQWGESHWNKGVPGHNMQALSTYKATTEIIGDIHNNPDLLTAEKAWTI